MASEIDPRIEELQGTIRTLRARLFPSLLAETAERMARDPYYRASLGEHLATWIADYPVETEQLCED